MGCPMTAMARSQWEQHIHHCTFLETACYNPGCDWRGPLNKTPDHDLNCPYELSECYICKLQLPRGFPHICLVKLIERVEQLEKLVESTKEEKDKETQEVLKRDRKIAKLNNRLQHLEVLLNGAGYENVSQEEDEAPTPPKFANPKPPEVPEVHCSWVYHKIKANNGKRQRRFRRQHGHS